MKKTLIVSAFPGCGKTYLYENQEHLTFKNEKFTFQDSDSSHYEKHENWAKEYVNDLKKLLGTVDFIFVSQHEILLAELEAQHIPFVVVAPDNSKSELSDKQRQLIKQQWFGRFILRDNSHIKDFDKWLNCLKKNYDDWTSSDNLKKHHPIKIIRLKEDEYLSDVIEDLHWIGENLIWI